MKNYFDERLSIRILSLYDLLILKTVDSVVAWLELTRISIYLIYDYQLDY